MTWLGDELGRIADDMPERDLTVRAYELHRRRRRNLVALTAAALVVVVVLAGTVTTRLLPGRAADAVSPPAPPEQSTVDVGWVPTAAALPLFVAQSEGYFAAEGLTVRPVSVQAGAAGVPLLLTKRLAIVESDYCTALATNALGKDIKIVGGMHRAGPRSLALTVPAGSRIRDVSGLKDKWIAVPGLSGLPTLALTALLERHGLARQDVKLAETSYPDMVKGLNRGRFAAALLAEPFVTAGASKVRVLEEAMSGEFAGLPDSGWAATGEWARANPRTLAAFQRAIAKAQRRIAADPALVARTLPKYLRIDPRAAARADAGSYPVGLDVRGLQRLADLARRHRFLRGPIDVRTVIASPG
ncbi:ABC transporter substrate-binding protein [Actinomadura sp. ATCC 31491]|uniref:ABC transporter substrate-binding protein n=1 Tax=Actinomadura luzonensis TaxID=2805427 RepID=A0ABT0G8M5_9ACTN|nr:ABC transporter substrate-binding protein [Actinomadura luzonensis]MCK2220937.1 ABC transporter substrate-binding protein [Actinomadura luzonensis]